MTAGTRTVTAKRDTAYTEADQDTAAVNNVQGNRTEAEVAA